MNVTDTLERIEADDLSPRVLKSVVLHLHGLKAVELYVSQSKRLMDVFTAASELIAYEYDVFGVDGHIITEDVRDEQWVSLYNELKAAVMGGKHAEHTG